jgi:predicted metalloprotease with PDZ domain
VTVPAVRYRLAIPEPHTHLVHVEVRVEGIAGAAELVMPSWTPGSYLLREFPRNVQQFSAVDGSGRSVGWAKVDKNSWRLEPVSDGGLTVRYVVYANELTVRTSHVDASHASINGASVFMFVRGREQQPVQLEIEPRPGWQVTTPLPAAGRAGCFRADDYRHLVDSPIEMGSHTVIDFEACGKPHRYVVWGRADIDEERLVADTASIVRTAQRFWGTLPYQQYTFFLHLVPGSRGGLEHRDSCSLHADPHAFRGPEYEQFIALVAHEFFHTWNGTRIRPEPLVGPDLTRENYTRNLWVVEGLTTYYTDLWLCRAGLISAGRYLERLAEAIHRLQTLPGRHVQTLSDSSFDTWIKFYRPDEHTPNAQVSYYHKGALVGLLLDMRIRKATNNRKSLDDVMRLLWERYGRRDIGFPEASSAGVQHLAEEVCGELLDDFFAAYLFGTGELDFDEALQTVGLRLCRVEERSAPVTGGWRATGVATTDPSPSPPAGVVAAVRPDPLSHLGLRVELRDGRVVVAYVRSGSPAHGAGINARDELIAVNGLRFEPPQLSARLAQSRCGEVVRFSAFRRGSLVNVEVTFPESGEELKRIAVLGSASPEQITARQDWLGQSSVGGGIGPVDGLHAAR